MRAVVVNPSAFLLVSLLLAACTGDKPGTDTAGTDPAGDTGCGCPEPVTFYADLDADGYGDPDNAVEACDAPSGYVGNAADCDDADASVHPDADESCNGVDDDCDGEVDEDPADGDTWYADADGDGYGDPDAPVLSCDQPSGAVPDDSDCDDGDANTYPGAPELCDGVQNDCDAGWTSDAGTATWFGDDGTIADLTPTFATGVDGAPATWSSADSGLLRVCGGTWYVSVELSGDEVEVEGIDAPVLDGGAAARVLSLGAAVSASVHDLSLQRGSATGQGGCLYAHDGFSLSVDSVDLEACEAGSDGGALAVDTVTNLTLSGVRFDGNTAGGDGGGAWVEDGTVTFDTLAVEDNATSGGGGGIYVGFGTAFTVTGGSFTSNTAGGTGGGLHCAADASNVLVVSDTTFTGNVSGDQGGAYFANRGSGTDGCGSSTFSDVEMSGNYAANYGGAVSDHGVDSVYERVQVIDNWTDRGIGAMYLRGTTKTLVDSVVSGNSSNEVGAIYMDEEDTTVTLENTEVSDNTGGNGYGAIGLRKGTLICQGDTSVDTYGIWGNTAGYADGLNIGEDATFVATDCDLGDGSATPDNDGTDIYMFHNGATYNYGNDATFTCDGATGTCN